MPALRLTLLSALSLLLLGGCRHSASTGGGEGEAAVVDLDSIRHRGILRAVCDYNSLNYFVHKGVPVGYQYELLRCYAEHLGVQLDLVADNTVEGGYEKLSTGRADILASSLVSDTALLPPMLLCEPYGQSRVVVVGRQGEVSSTDSLAALRGDTIACMASSFYSRALSAEMEASGVDYEVLEIEHYDAEQLLSMVSEGEIKQALCLENIARANKWYYDNLAIGPALTGVVDMSWGVRTTSPELRDDISRWLADFKQSRRFKRIYRKYVIDPREHHNNSESNVSADTYRATYEPMIRRVATDPRYDWHFLSAVVYQESHFNPQARSWAGAQGLMQLMPETAARFGADDPMDPESSLEAGYAFLLWLDARLYEYVPDGQERRKFVLASYNVGLGHIMDAIRLAGKFEKRADVWEGAVETALLLKANPSYYSDPCVKHGMCRGTETVAYVRNVMQRYRNYSGIRETTAVE